MDPQVRFGYRSTRNQVPTTEPDRRLNVSARKELVQHWDAVVHALCGDIDRVTDRTPLVLLVNSKRF